MEQIQLCPNITPPDSTNAKILNLTLTMQELIVASSKAEYHAWHSIILQLQYITDLTQQNTAKAKPYYTAQSTAVQ